MVTLLAGVVTAVVNGSGRSAMNCQPAIREPRPMGVAEMHPTNAAQGTSSGRARSKDFQNASLFQ